MLAACLLYGCDLSINGMRSEEVQVCAAAIVASAFIVTICGPCHDCSLHNYIVNICTQWSLNFKSLASSASVLACSTNLVPASFLAG